MLFFDFETFAVDIEMLVLPFADIKWAIIIEVLVIAHPFSCINLFGIKEKDFAQIALH